MTQALRFVINEGALIKTFFKSDQKDSEAHSRTRDDPLKHVSMLGTTLRASLGKGDFHALQEDLVRKQNVYPDKSYCCPICERSIEEVNKYNQKLLGTWVLDHCHDTNTFRGYICKHCNDGLGGFRDDLTTIERAVIYLKEHKERLNEVND